MKQDFEIKSEWIYCLKHSGNIKKEECLPGEYRDCKNCPQFIKPSTESTKAKDKSSHRKNKSANQPETPPPKKIIIEETLYCQVAQQGIVKERCVRVRYPGCKGCSRDLVSEEKIKPKQRLTLATKFIEKDLSEFEKFLGLPKFGLGLNTIAQLNECKDYIIMAVKTMDTPTKRSEINAELEFVFDKAKDFLKILGNLSTASKFLLESELYRPAQKSGLNVCPFCMENLKKISVKDHIGQCHPDQVDMIKEASIDEDLIDRCYSDTNRILLAAHKAIKRKKDFENKGGRPRSTGFKEGVYKLCQLFNTISNKTPSNYYSPRLKKYEGHLFKFVNFFILRISPLHAPSNYSLGQIIREIKAVTKKKQTAEKNKYFFKKI